MVRNNRSCILVLVSYVAFVSFYLGQYSSSPSSSSSSSASININYGVPFSDAPFLIPSSSAAASSVNSLIDQLRDKFFEDDRALTSEKKAVSYTNDNKNTNITSSSSSSTQKTILCCIALHEEAYIDEFVDYHIGIGFRKIIVYDNSDHYELKQWGDERNRRRRKRRIKRRGNDNPATSNNTNQVDYDDNHDDTNNEVHVIHYPGKGKQGAAYLDCAQRAYHGEFGDGIENAAFWDVDEFLILKQHTSVDELLQEYMINKGASSLSINWHMFRHGNRHVYKPLPVTKRFLYREREVQAQIKSMVHLQDMDMKKSNHPHYPHLKNSTTRIDTNGTKLSGMWNHNGPTNVAILHHYKTKSYAEYIKKRERGRAAVANWNPVDRHSGYEKNHKEAVDEYIKAMRKYNYTSSSSVYFSDYGGDDDDDDEDGRDQPVFDNTAWTMMKRACPKYSLYDLLDEA